MRVLNPRSTNFMYKLHQKLYEKIGDAGDIGVFAVAGVAAPFAAGLFVDSGWSLASCIGFYGLASYRSYRTECKTRKRLSTLIEIRNRIPAEYHNYIDKFVAEVYHCGNVHFSYTVGTRGFKYSNEVKLNSSGAYAGLSNTSSRINETEAEWAIREQKELLLKAGHGCEYCGKRLKAAQDLLDECLAGQVEDNSSVESVLEVIERKKTSNEFLREFSKTTNEIMKELT